MTDEFKDVGRYFDGKSESVVMPGPPLQVPCTILGWFIWLSGDSSLLSDAAAQWSLGHDSDGHLAYTAGGNEFVTSIDLSPLRQGWHFYAMSMSQTSGSYYLDGSLRHQGHGDALVPPSMPWSMMWNPKRSSFIEGFAADVGMYDRELSEVDLHGLWKAGKHRK